MCVNGYASSQAKRERKMGNQLYVSVSFTTSHIPSHRCNSSLPRRSYWYRPGRAFRLLADSVTIFRNTALCLYCMLASNFIVFIASYIWKVAWEKWLQFHLKALYGGVGALRWLLPCGNFVTSCAASFDLSRHHVIIHSILLCKAVCLRNIQVVLFLSTTHLHCL